MNYPKYIKRDGYIGTFQYVDRGGFPIYRFPGGVTVAEDLEILTGSNNKEDLLCELDL